MPVRRSIYALSLAEVQAFTDALNTLKQSGVYDQFVTRHHTAMMTFTPTSQSVRNAAHKGPSFLPWHRQSLLEFESALAAILPDFGIPYWPWEADAALPDPKQALIWTADYFGGNGLQSNGWYVQDGPFVSWQAIILNSSTGQLVPRSRTGLIRKFAVDTGATTLPTQADVTDCLTESQYDHSPWIDSQTTSPSFRNRIEGFLRHTGESSTQARMHGRVHRWVGGDMGVSTSPNDPIFWLHHSNVDRIWSVWQASGHATDYLPVTGGPAGHNLNDALLGLATSGVTPASLLDITALGYSYA
ncbi:tyrosinase family protein [Frankia sp. Mgl5]|uniref:tyrosinase family protein n=1 Tax=Frankia sp. Mgl5 TaxID=2933793 RepID=UPI00200E1A29|nr:tyrosinase family protein [Frankia sp. Mgl5]MCK9930099.1 tyrosinase family protein [Frankia sp. Mgl5]